MDENPTHLWIEPLSEREIEILGLISDGLSNREISQELSLSVETIKWHNKQIFSKLGVNRRMQAVYKAQEHGLLESKTVEKHEQRSSPPNNLPTPLSSFIGRNHEIDAIKQLLKTSRLVVLTGPGGSGKTRLAIEVASSLIDAFRDGICFVELGSTLDPSLMAETMAQSLGLRMGAEGSPKRILKDFLGSKHLLLLLDNLEHLLEAAPLIGELLTSAPMISVLATSRERLHLSGEQEFPVQPLRLPDLNLDPEVEGFYDIDSVHLFIQRAQAKLPDFHPDESQLEAIAQICIMLDGLPLAIELAASHVKTLPPVLLAEELEENLDALLSGPRDLPKRQRTLRATMAWSYELLKATEKELFARLSVFQGGSTLEGIRQVCGRDLSEEVTPILARLVEKNLVISREDFTGEPRFTMLETVHAFARELIEGTDEGDQLRHRHAAYFTELMMVAAEEMRTGKQIYWFDRLQAEQENLRSILSWSLNGAHVEYGLKIAHGMMDYWFYYGRGVEGRRWIELALDKSPESKPLLRAGVLQSAGRITYVIGNPKEARQYQHEALELYKEAGEERKIGWTLMDLGIMYLENEGEIKQGIAYAEQGLEILRSIDDKPGMASALNILGELTRVLGDDAASKRYYEESLAVVKETGERWREAMLYSNLCYLACHGQDFELALQHIRKAIQLVQEINNEYWFAYLLGTAAGPAAGLGRWEDAARLLGASDGLYEKLGSMNQPADQVEHESMEANIRTELGGQAFEAAWEAGHEVPTDEMISFVLHELSPES